MCGMWYVWRGNVVMWYVCGVVMWYDRKCTGDSVRLFEHCSVSAYGCMRVVKGRGSIG